jgi:C_GCAxxG_C_C family probable redox protein
MGEKSENYYLANDFRCSEAVLRVIWENFKTDLPEEIVSLATGFPHGVGGSGCICGALAGGTMALGMFFGRSAAGEEDKLKKIWNCRMNCTIYLKRIIRSPAAGR